MRSGHFFGKFERLFAKGSRNVLLQSLHDIINKGEYHGGQTLAWKKMA